MFGHKRSAVPLDNVHCWTKVFCLPLDFLFLSLCLIIGGLEQSSELWSDSSDADMHSCTLELVCALSGCSPALCGSRESEIELFLPAELCLA